MVQIGVSSFVMYPESIESILDFAAEQKIKHVEFVMGPLNKSTPDDFDVNRIMDLSKRICELDITPYVHVAPEDNIPSSVVENIRQGVENEIRDAIDFAADIGARTTVTHAGNYYARYAFKGITIDDVKYMHHKSLVKTLNNCIRYANGRGRKLLVENGYSFAGLNNPCLAVTTDELKNLFAECPGMGLVVDIGKISDSNLDILDFIIKTRKIVEYYHVCDKDENRRNIALGTGKIDFKEIIPEMADVPLIIELNGREAAAQSIDYLRKINDFL